MYILDVLDVKVVVWKGRLCEHIIGTSEFKVSGQSLRN